MNSHFKRNANSCKNSSWKHIRIWHPCHSMNHRRSEAMIYWKTCGYILLYLVLCMGQRAKPWCGAEKRRKQKSKFETKFGIDTQFVMIPRYRISCLYGCFEFGYLSPSSHDLMPTHTMPVGLIAKHFLLITQPWSAAVRNCEWKKISFNVSTIRTDMEWSDINFDSV